VRATDRSKREGNKALPSEESNMLNQPKMFIIIQKMKTIMMMAAVGMRYFRGDWQNKLVDALVINLYSV